MAACCLLRPRQTASPPAAQLEPPRGEEEAGGDRLVCVHLAFPRVGCLLWVNHSKVWRSP